ncbi:response regulator transcription factor [Aeromonas veronii]|uniref:response regulator transcription factor n=1 Tax=Aeromonas TaxID=642 RepID=UPI00111768B0|nr:MULTISPECIES: response regulator transcription factor [Aeromonas]MBF3237963.1 response regulator transcription factor [Aeromonas veronii]MBL0632965.1 response regulator transcription factor [Aeromonas veronii]QWZ96211.1 response regulator transcription factor [Aeromonas sp. FDAARGOS 1411]
MATIMIVDDHPAIRMAVGILLKSKGHQISGEFDNGIDALAQIRQQAPDILVLDINIPRIDGFDVIKRCHELAMSPRIIVLSAHDSDHVKTRCVQLGVSAFVSKLDDLTKLSSVVEQVLAGYVLFDQALRFDAAGKSDIDSAEVLKTLSMREMSVLMALARGDNNKKIANDLVLSEKTISTYKTRLMTKLQLNNIVDLLNFAKRHNLV